MKTLKTLVLALFIVILGLTSQAQASTMSWNVITAETDAFAIFGGGHAFYLPASWGTIQSTDPQFVFVDTGLFVEDFDNNTARLTGQIVGINDATDIWNVDIMFSLAPDPNQTIDPKRELIPAAYSENSGPVDVSTWHYWNIVQGSTLTGEGKNDALQLWVLQRFAEMPFQVGFGASGKNILLGGSTWLSYTGDYEGWGDINVNFRPIPEPASMVLFGTGLIGGIFTRRRRA